MDFRYGWWPGVRQHVYPSGRSAPCARSAADARIHPLLAVLRSLSGGPGSPIRESQYAGRTPVLSHDGRDLSAALQTILEIGDARGLADSIEDSFPGSRLQITGHDGRLGVTLSQKGLLRPLGAAELSDGTLRFLLWIAGQGHWTGQIGSGPLGREARCSPRIRHENYRQESPAGS